jgi:cytidylate kinase
MKRGLIVAIDGPVGSGKSTTAHLLAQRLGFLHLDSGAMYRAVGWKSQELGIDPADDPALGRLCRSIRVEMTWEGNVQRTFVDGVNVTEKIRTPEVSRLASRVSMLRSVREYLGRLQREIGWREAAARGGVVMEGRDIGTAIFPDAQAKFYLDGDVRDRGKRRWEELRARGIPAELEETIAEVRHRDQQDTERELAPLRRADDAHRIDTTGLTPERVVDRMAETIRGLSVRE